MGTFLWLALLLPSEPPPPRLPPPPAVAASTERFLAQFTFNDLPLAVMYPTTVTLYSRNSRVADAVPTPYFEIPDEDTELVELAIDLRRRIILKMVYVTKKDF